MKTKNQDAIQEEFIKTLRSSVPESISLADELADLLKVSPDSAYRRLRGETDFTLDEIYLIAKKFNISVDAVFAHKSDTVTCNYTMLTDSEENFEKYLSGIANQLKLINTFSDKQIIYAAEEVPIMHSFQNKKLTAFKLFYWQRSVLNIAKYQGKKFEFDVIPEKLMNIAKEIHANYMAIPSLEIWTDDTIVTAIKQILFYYESGAFNTTKDAVEILKSLREMVEATANYAELEQKPNTEKNSGGAFQLYNSELVIGTNCIHVHVGDKNISYISFNTMNSLTTNNQLFCGEIEHWMKNLIKKSSLISGSAEKQRFQFFKQALKHIDTAIEKISA